MLEKPNIQDQSIISAVQDEYGLEVAQLAFLPLGYDVNTAVYRLLSADGAAWFLKLRKGDFSEISVAVPHFLSAQGIRAIIAPLETRAGQLWGTLDSYRMILYPFVEGQNGYSLALSDRQWIEFGLTLKAIHTVQVPQTLARLIPRETWSPRWREMVRTFQAQVETTIFSDPVAAKLAGFMRSRRAEISHVVARAEQLGLALKSRSLELVLCHSDIHAGNLLLSAGGAIYIVDWDNPILAPKERDLMFVGMGGVWRADREEELFYMGYGGSHTPGYNHGERLTQVDWMALAYYRYERVVQDIAAFCEQLLLTSAGGEDREQAYQYFTSNFLPGHEIEVARQTDMRLK